MAVFVTEAQPTQAEIGEQATEVAIDPATDQLPAPTKGGAQVPGAAVEQLEEEPAAVQTEQQSNIETAIENSAREEGEDVAQKSHFELINQARHVYQCGDITNSIDLYRELGELYPEDPNVYGELGNVFYSKGEWKQASLAYYEAALRLHKRNQQEQIHYLYRVIQGLDPETAEKLRGQLGS